jgi:hypothetical protein
MPVAARPPAVEKVHLGHLPFLVTLPRRGGFPWASGASGGVLAIHRDFTHPRGLRRLGAPRLRNCGPARFGWANWSKAEPCSPIDARRSRCAAIGWMARGSSGGGIGSASSSSAAWVPQRPHPGERGGSVLTAAETASPRPRHRREPAPHAVQESGRRRAAAATGRAPSGTNPPVRALSWRQGCRTPVVYVSRWPICSAGQVPGRCAVQPPRRRPAQIVVAAEVTQTATTSPSSLR